MKHRLLLAALTLAALAAPAVSDAAYLYRYAIKGAAPVDSGAASDTTPDAFNFMTRTAVSGQWESETLTISGINAPTTVTASGAEVSVAGGPWAASGTIAAGQTLRLRQAAPATATVAIGGVSDQWGYAEYAAAGAYSFVVPAGVTQARALALGAGGGGAGGGAYQGIGGGGGGGGGGGAVGQVAVTAGGTVAVTVGAGGAGGNGCSQAGGNGGNSSFGALVVAGGGRGAPAGCTGSGAGGTGTVAGGAGGVGQQGTWTATPGNPGGNGGASGGAVSAGGGSSGGNCAGSNPAVGLAGGAPAGNGGSGLYGGGGRGGYNCHIDQYGGAGATGYVRVEW